MDKDNSFGLTGLLVRLPHKSKLFLVENNVFDYLNKTDKFNHAFYIEKFKSLVFIDSVVYGPVDCGFKKELRFEDYLKKGMPDSLKKES